MTNFWIYPPCPPKYAKFQNPTTTPSGILGTAARVRVRLIPKIVAYVSCSAGRMHFARTNYVQVVFYFHYFILREVEFLKVLTHGYTDSRAF